jgi:hypothetical protein
MTGRQATGRLESVMLMNADLRRSWLWPCVFAIILFSIPLLLFHWYPSSVWVSTEYEMEGIADALNMAYRLADHRLYFARGMSEHPGVPFYLMSWLALALAGYPVASGPGYFNAVIEHAEVFHQISVWLAALVGAIGVLVFTRVARNLVPIGVVAIGLLIWLVSTPASLLMLVSPSIESFAILINALFFAILVRLAYDRDLSSRVAILCGCVSAFAYLIKLSYIYVLGGLAVAGFASAARRRAGWIRARQLSLLFAFGYLLVLVATAVFITGWDGFLILVRFHLRVIFRSGMYGTGDQIVFSKDEIWRALAAIPVDRAYAILIALVGGPCLVIGGFLTGRKGPEHVPVAVIGIGTGVASVLSALFVLKHYGFHYTAGVSATLPASATAGYLLARSWGWDYRIRTAAAALAAIAILLMANQIRGSLIPALAGRINTNESAKADLQEIRAQLAGKKLAVEFGYGAPFPQSGEGLVITYGSVQRLTDDYLLSRPDVIGSMASGLVDRDAGAYVIAKAYFPTMESIKAAPNLSMFGRKPVRFKDGDKVIELRTAFLLIPSDGPENSNTE